MAMYICSHCGYEGIGKADPNRGEGAAGGLTRFLGIVTMLPFHSFYKVFRPKRGKVCPNCGLHRMVKMSSDEGWIAQKKFERELGLSVKKQETSPPEPAPTLTAIEEDKARKQSSEPRNVDPDAW